MTKTWLFINIPPLEKGLGGGNFEENGLFEDDNKLACFSISYMFFGLV